MDLAYLQLPLVFFTAAAPMSSGAFIGLAIAFATTRFSAEELGRIDRWTLLPLAILAASFVAVLAFSFAPQSALLAIQGVGLGSLGFVAVMAVLFAVAALVYWVVAMVGKLADGVRKVYVGFLGVLAVVLSVAIGVAYSLSDVSTWASPVVPLGFAGYCVVGGVPLGMFVVAAARALPTARATRFGSIALISAFVGAVVSIFAVTVLMMNAQATAAAVLPGVDFLPGAWVYLVVSIVGFVAVLACMRGSLGGGRSSAPLGSTAGASAMPWNSFDDAPVGDPARTDTVRTDAAHVRDTASAGESTAATASSVGLLALGNVAVLVALVAARVLFYALQI
ncbi:DmsC/YnfH family molybdoenzyme membrane anchor subunit [Gordonibacter massiliensis (ex Traore et al. 2017)]|uniref:DmsC/YnfH family molybdoenzyme membrane anchor subunit n=1 Tax=Gordonibacter massiliensis (ex Traore et al. 2017) TaxID=1841863 RepID=UPI001C8BDE3F|nr:DmsC/YnfH family molybdoenzyme membrane anchor subunit [Gordonibacter massiliensis (ex Traore et al. 2017)]MBX9033443.1 dimethyl sulfoxide reductase anchor subunit [Gordonibacter massiliensis (ex Traore et al. 2017)]